MVNKSLVKETWTLRESIFYRAELPVLAKYPPAQGFRVLNLHKEVRCLHLMPIIRHKIEQNGLLDAWRQVKTFSCVDTTGELQEDLEDLDSKALEFLKPGEQVKRECAMSSLTAAVYQQCRAQGHVDFEFFETAARQFPTDYSPDIESLRLPDLVRDRPQLLLILPDVMEMFDTTISSELCLAQFADQSIKARLDANLLHQACREAHAALPKLRQDLAVGSLQVRIAAVKVLGAMGKEAVGALPELQNVFRGSKSPFVRGAAATALGAIGKEAAGAVVPELRQALKDSNANVRAGSAQALWAMGKEAVGAMPELQYALRDSEWLVRAAAAMALGSMGKEAVGTVPELQNALQDLHEGVRAAAARALSAIGKEVAGAEPELREAVNDTS